MRVQVGDSEPIPMRKKGEPLKIFQLYYEGKYVCSFGQIGSDIIYFSNSFSDIEIKVEGRVKDEQDIRKGNIGQEK